MSPRIMDAMMREVAARLAREVTRRAEAAAVSAGACDPDGATASDVPPLPRGGLILWTAGLHVLGPGPLLIAGM